MKLFNIFAIASLTISQSIWAAGDSAETSAQQQDQMVTAPQAQDPNRMMQENPTAAGEEVKEEPLWVDFDDTLQ